MRAARESTGLFRCAKIRVNMDKDVYLCVLVSFPCSTHTSKIDRERYLLFPLCPKPDRPTSSLPLLLTKSATPPPLRLGSIFTSVSCSSCPASPRRPTPFEKPRRRVFGFCLPLPVDQPGSYCWVDRLSGTLVLLVPGPGIVWFLYKL